MSTETKSQDKRKRKEIQQTDARRFNSVLKKDIRPDDNAWIYTVPSLPPPEETNPLRLIKSIRLFSTPRGRSIKLQFETAPSSRITWVDPLDRLLLLSFASFQLQHPVLQEEEHTKSGTPAETADYIFRLLKTGLILNGTPYHFFGHSNSQLKSRSCFMFAASKSAISAKVEALGDFSKIRSVSKKAKRIGLLFAPAEHVMKLEPDCVEDINDVERNGYIFTDGCGLISKSLARTSAKTLKSVYRNTRYLPSVYQIRYRGYKGVLTLDPRLTGKILAQFRLSMRKFEEAKDYSFGVIENSKPYSFGYLNDEHILLLNTLGITAQNLLKKQSDYHNFLRAASKGDIISMFQFLCFIDRFDLGESLLLEGADVVFDTVQRLLQAEYGKMMTRRREQKCRILILKSRLLFGVCEPPQPSNISNRLKSGTCFVRITDHSDGQARTIINTEVLVTRNPCLHPGDLQKFRAVDVPEFSHLIDCIVFSTSGERPSADLMSGGDLDGDKFIVIWDPDIIPRKISEPAMYPQVQEQISFSAPGDDDRAKYFARYTSTSISGTKILYLKWARSKGPMSAECQQLNRLYSLALDGKVVTVPASLQDPPDAAVDATPFILDVLHSAVKETIEAASVGNIRFLDAPISAMDLLLSNDVIAIPEFDLIQLTIRWCRRYGQDFWDYSCFFNFGALTDSEQAWTLGQLPPSKSGPALVRNGLLQSNIVSPEELRRFGLDHHGFHWKCIFDSSFDTMGRFMSSACDALELFHKKLILIRPDERLLIAILIKDKIPKANDTHVSSNVRVLALPQSQGPDSPHYRVAPTTLRYRLYCDETTFQLYDGKRQNTFVFLKRDVRNSSQGNNNNKEDRRWLGQSNGANFMASIALDKLGKGIQTHVGRIYRARILAAETYVISNRDVQSMTVLDQWLEHVDTEEILPIFDRPQNNYASKQHSRLNGDGTLVRDVALRVLEGENMLILQKLSSFDEVLQLLELLHFHNEYRHLRSVYTELLDLDAGRSFLVPQDNSQGHNVNMELSQLLLCFLQKAPYLASAYFSSQIWKDKKDHLRGTLTTLGPALLKELILAANTFHHAVRGPFLVLVKNLERLSLNNFSELMELLSLVIADAELAIDLLFECLEPELRRLLVGNAMEVENIMKCYMGIALNHIDRFSSRRMPDMSPVQLTSEGIDPGGYQMAKFALRVDAPLQLQVGDHVRLRPNNAPQNDPQHPRTAIDAMVTRSYQDVWFLRCLHRLPTYAEVCSWELVSSESFVTAKTMFDAILMLHSQKSACCKLYPTLIGCSDTHVEFQTKAHSFLSRAMLNDSQKKAVEVAVSHSCSFIWAPKGTGSMNTTLAIVDQLQIGFPHTRILVAASSHQAVDNILRRYIAHRQATGSGTAPLRVSTRLRKVAPDLLPYTCDAMVEQNIAESIYPLQEAQRHVHDSRLVFTTCVGAGLGLLRSEMFDIVLLVNAAQQTRSESLIPLSKGCHRAIFIGDHAKPRVKVRKHATIADFDISLFERFYGMVDTPGVARVLLDTQYEVHRDICDFNSKEFYQNKLRSLGHNTSLPPSTFPWPKNHRMVFLQSGAPEDLGRQSKVNQGQVKICQTVFALLQSAASPAEQNVNTTQIVILTPYTRQKCVMQKAMPTAEICTVGEFQDRSADIVVFVSVRCNAHLELGYLRDARLMNTVMMGAKAGIIIIGDKPTLTGMEENSCDTESKAMWGRLLTSCVQVELQANEPRPRPNIA